MLKHVSEFPSFLRLNNILLIVHTTFCLSIHLLMNSWIVSIFWLLQIMLLQTWVYKYLFKCLLSVLLDIYPQVEFMDCILILVLNFVTAILFSLVAIPVYQHVFWAPTNRSKTDKNKSLFSCILYEGMGNMHDKLYNLLVIMDFGKT